MPQVWAPAHKALPIMIQNIWKCNVEWRPNACANWPDTGTKVVNVNVYAATIQLKLPERRSKDLSVHDDNEGRGVKY